MRVAALALAGLLSACGGSGDGPASAPTNVSVVAHDTYVTVSFDQQPGYTYWIFSAAADSITRDNYLQFPSARLTWPATSPQVISGLTNGTTYSFIINATKGGSQAGPASASISAVPRIAGVNWTAGTAISGVNVRGLAYGYANYIAVGNGGAIYKTADKGTTWTATTSNVTDDLYGAVTGSSLVMAVGAGGKVLTTTDATTWTVQTNAATTATLYGVTYGSAKYVAEIGRAHV